MPASVSIGSTSDSGHGGGQRRTRLVPLWVAPRAGSRQDNARERKLDGKRDLNRERAEVALCRQDLLSDIIDQAVSCMMYGGYCYSTVPVYTWLLARPLTTRALKVAWLRSCAQRESIASHRVFAVSGPNNLALPLSLSFQPFVGRLLRSA